MKRNKEQVLGNIIGTMMIAVGATTFIPENVYTLTDAANKSFQQAGGVGSILFGFMLIGLIEGGRRNMLTHQRRGEQHDQALHEQGAQPNLEDLHRPKLSA